MSILKQDHFAYNSFTVLDTIIQGNPRLYEIMQEKDALYAKPDFSEEDGIRASELEGEFAELAGCFQIGGIGIQNGLLAGRGAERLCHA